MQQGRRETASDGPPVLGHDRVDNPNGADSNALV
jgi:hypothetical protein